MKPWVTTKNGCTVWTVGLVGIDHYFSEDEIWSIIRSLPVEKAPGPVGFTGLFYQTAWPIIKHDIVAVFSALWSLDFRSFYLVNQTYMILLRKKVDAEEVKDYRPISLIHSFNKLFAKALAVRLAPFMHELVWPNQSAFICGRAIHDNFRTMQSTTKWLHARRRSSILLKIDIAKAFYTVSWPFLIELLHHLGLSQRWLNWVSILLSTASTKILLNGQLGRHICHAWGLRQGDPLSPLLFMLTVEALNTLFHLAEEHGLFRSLRVAPIQHILFLYVDDLVIFITPDELNLATVKAVLEVFAGASGLRTNINKCQFTLIRCTPEQVQPVQQIFPCQLVNFRCKYLGNPLSVYKLKNSDLHPLVDKVADRLPTWKAKMMSRSGRTTLTKVTLSPISVHVSITVKVVPWILRAINRLHRASYGPEWRRPQEGSVWWRGLKLLGQWNWVA
jgi:hypothetical protein